MLHLPKPTCLISTGVFVLALLLCGCEDDSTKLTPEQELVRALSSATWAATNVTLDDVAQPDFAGFALSFTGTLKYSVSGGPKTIPFPASGAWKLGDPITEKLILGAGNQNIETTYELTDTALTISFSYAGKGFPNGRSSGLDGLWRFVFSQN